MYPQQQRSTRPAPYQPASPAGGGLVQRYATARRPGLGDLPLGLLAGGVSATFGVVQMLAPRLVARTVGMTYPPWVLRAIGLRDLALGLVMLARPTPRWRWVRVGNDMFDYGIIAAAAFLPGAQRRRLAGFAAFAAGIVALDLGAARRGSHEPQVVR
jgi:hypothetical protein